MPGVVLPQRAHPDDADRQPGRHAGTPRSLDSTKARKRSTSGNAGRSVRARSSACDRFRSELKKSRYARLSAATVSPGEAGPLEAERVETVELHRIADGLHVRRDVLVDPGAAAHERVGADGDELMDGVEPAEDGAIVDGDVAGALGGVGDHHVIADVTVVREVHVGHDEATRAHRGLERRGGRAVDGRILADDGSLPDLDPGLLATVLEILRVSAQDRPVADPHVFGQPHVPLQRGPGADPAAVADGHLGTDDGPGSDRHAGAQPGRRIDQRRSGWITDPPPAPSSPLPPPPGRRRRPRPSCGRCAPDSAASRARSGAGRREARAGGT